MSNESKAFVSWETPEEFESASASYGDFLKSGNAVARNSPTRRDFSGLTPVSGGKPGLTDYDFDWFRPDQAAPRTPREIISFARSSYRKIGLIHNAIDLMGDFASQGVRISHRSASAQKFFKKWFEHVKGANVSERLANLLFREANVVVKSYDISLKKNSKEIIKESLASEDIVIEPAIFDSIPWRYTFIDPLLVDVMGQSLSTLKTKKTYVLKLPMRFRSQLSDTITEYQNSGSMSFFEDIPKEILDAMQTGKDFVILDPESTFVLHYKKDDWQIWADPIVFSAFEDLNLYHRLKLADKAALDGATSKIRVWKLGSLEHKLAPTTLASNTLNEMISSNVGGGTVDIIWGPDIELIETNSDVHNFLGEGKYKPTLMSIYATLGIPPTLTGTFGSGSGTTNNFISLKTLTKRLNYVRSIITEFWDHQIRIVQKAMGFRYPAVIEYDYMDLEDPASILSILLNMADRNIISDELLQNYIKANPDLESQRISKENKSKEKVSPYHPVDKDHILKKIVLQQGVVTPSEVGVELDEKEKGQQPAIIMREKAKQHSQPKGRPEDPGNFNNPLPPGRPKNSNDKQQRQEKRFQPKVKASEFSWAKSSYQKISDVFHPIILDFLNKKTLRNLTAAEFNLVEDLKFEILCNLDIGDDINLQSVMAAMNNPDKSIHGRFLEWAGDISDLTVAEIRELKTAFFLFYKVD
jgi:hypothetical protein